MSKFITVLSAILAVIVVILFQGVLFGFLIQWCWNTAMPHMFQLPSISFYQALAFFVLIRLLIGVAHVKTKE